MVQIPIEGKIKPLLRGGRVADIADVDGALVKSVTAAGVATLQLADGTETTVTLTTGTTLDGAFINALTAQTLLDDSEYPAINDSNEIRKVAIEHLGAWMQANLARFLPTHGDMETDRYPVAIGTANEYGLRRGAPPALPAAPNQAVVSNAAGDAYELAHHLTASDVFPHVAALPDFTLDTSPDFVYLDHDVVTGPQEDATITVGRVGSLGWGWSTVSGGSINRSNTGLTGIYGIGSAANYSINTVSSLNEALLRTLRNIIIDGTTYAMGAIFQSGATWLKNITNGPTGLSGATITVNFTRADDTFFFVGSGGIVSFFSGLYEKTTSAYSRIVSGGFAHTRGIGPPLIDPDYEGQLYINDLGDLWVAGGTLVHTTIAATGTSSILTNSKYVRVATTQDDLLTNGGDGGFTWISGTLPALVFSQQEGVAVNVINNRAWDAVWTYITTVTGGDNAANRRLRDNSVFLGAYSDVEDAFQALGQRIDQAAFDAGTTDYYFAIYNRTPNEYGLRGITSWVAPVNTTTDTLFWNGPFQTEYEVSQWVINNGIAINTSLVQAGFGLSHNDRHDIDFLGDIIEKTYDLALVQGLPQRTWVAANVTTGTAYEGALNFIEHSAIPTLVEVQALDWDNATRIHARGPFWYIIRVPLAANLKYYQVTIIGTALNAVAHGTLLRRLRTDATYAYYGYYTNFYEQTTFTVEYDGVVTHTTDFSGQIHSHEIIQVTRVAYDLLTTYTNGAWYVIQEAA